MDPIYVYTGGSEFLLSRVGSGQYELGSDSLHVFVLISDERDHYQTTSVKCILLIYIIHVVLCFMKMAKLLYKEIFEIISVADNWQMQPRQETKFYSQYLTVK